MTERSGDVKARAGPEGSGWSARRPIQAPDWVACRQCRAYLIRVDIRSRFPRRRRSSIQRLSLQELREQLGVRRADVARRLGRSPQAVLQFEQGLDPKISTLGDYVRALADELDSITGDVTVTAAFDDDVYELDLGPGSGDDETGATSVGASSSEPSPAPPVERPSEAFAAREPRVNADAWKVGSATWFDPLQAQRMLDEGFIAISEDEIDVSDHPDDRTLAERLRAAPREAERASSDRAIHTFVRYWRTFLTAIRPGDIVVLPRHRSNIAVGIVLGDPIYVADEPDPKLRHRRPVDWIRPDVSKKDLPEDLARSAAARGTIGMIRAADAADRLRNGSN